MIKKLLEKRTLKSITLVIKNGSWSKLTFVTLSLLVMESVLPHGTVTSPPSRIWACYQENPESPDSPACIAAVISHGTQPLYDWNEINQANADGNHMQYVMNGNLPSGGRPEKYGGMDQVRSDWVATEVSPGPFTVSWTNTAPHGTAYYQVYITNETWTPDQPLTWESLILLAETDPSPAESTIDIPVTLPVRTGKHVIYSIWQRSDSPEAFYSTSDIDFGGSLSIDAYEEPTVVLLEGYPNPFSSSFHIKYKVNKEASVSLKVYTILGEEVVTLVDDFQGIDEYEVTFNGESLSNGVYFYVLQVGDFIQTKRIILRK